MNSTDWQSVLSDKTILIEEIGPRRKYLRLRVFMRNRAAILGAFVVLLLIVIAVMAPVLAPYDPEDQNLREAYRTPTPAHLFGTDEFGRDMLSRLIYGARITISYGVLGVVLAALVGIPIGLVGGYFGGWIDTILARATDILLAFPSILLALAVVAALGPELINVSIAISIYSMPTYIRLIRSATLKTKEEDYILAARESGAGHTRIIAFHILPNSITPGIVQATLNIAAAILILSSLGYLGLGAQPPTPEWGLMLSEGRSYIRSAPHLLYFPGLTIVLAVLGFNLLGDGLRDALDPKSFR